MCGICGIFEQGSRPVDEGVLRSMIGRLGHRGPDAFGVHLESPVGLAHSRLAIIDLSGGGQPMANEDASLWITFNGEIYNYIELAERLREKGHRFATRSDTEVILHLYEDLGEDCVRELNGQWAFAIWDRRRRRLFLSRDRMGVRPIYWTFAGGAFLFASEIKALFAHPAVPRDLDPEGLREVFTFWFPVAPRTCFRGIRELPAGHSLVVEGGEARTAPHWRFAFPPERASLSEEDCADRLLELLIDATRLRLRSDVPVGAYLSGGLDSTVTTALIRRFSSAPLRSFSVSFEDPEFDEARWQSEAVRFLGTEHQEVRCSSRDIARVFPEVVFHAEAPLVRTAPAPLYLLARLVRDSGFKVVLTGEGSDELLGGYDIFKEAKIRRFWAARPDSRWRPLLLKRLYPYLQNLQAQSPAYLKAFFRVRPEDLANPLFSHLPRWDLTAQTRLFFSDDLRAALHGEEPLALLERSLPAGFGDWDPFLQGQYLETTGLLPGYLLSSQGDRMAMAHGVEGRYPFLDPRVVSFSTTIPPRLKMKGLDEKHILKRAAGHLIPESVRKRPKQPYRAPDAKCFLSAGRATEPWVEELLSESRIRAAGVFHPAAVGKLVEKARKDQVVGIKDNMALVGILSTQLLVELFIRNPKSCPQACLSSSKK